MNHAHATGIAVLAIKYITATVVGSPGYSWGLAVRSGFRAVLVADGTRGAAPAHYQLSAGEGAVAHGVPVGPVPRRVDPGPATCTSRIRIRQSVGTVE